MQLCSFPACSFQVVSSLVFRFCSKAVAVAVAVAAVVVVEEVAVEVEVEAVNQEM